MCPDHIDHTFPFSSASAAYLPYNFTSAFLLSLYKALNPISYIHVCMDIGAATEQPTEATLRTMILRSPVFINCQ